MNLKIVIIASFLAVSTAALCQTKTEINNTDMEGRKQGHWIKKYPDESIMYDGYFLDDHPVGEFKRYNEDNSLMSILIFSEDGKEAMATMYHPNGRISSKGKYINQMKEGQWQFFSEYADDYLISEEQYTGNLRNGLSLKFFPDSTIAERIIYVNNIRQGEWIQYYPSGNIFLKSNYLNGKIYGKFEVWYDNGQIKFSGQYKNDTRDGLWYIYNKDGSIKYELEYQNGVSKNNQMDIDESKILDLMEKNSGKIADPEKTGVMKQ